MDASPTTVAPAAGLDEPAATEGRVAASAGELVVAAEIPAHENDRRAPVITVAQKSLRRFLRE